MDGYKEHQVKPGDITVLVNESGCTCKRHLSIYREHNTCTLYDFQFLTTVLFRPEDGNRVVQGSAREYEQVKRALAFCEKNVCREAAYCDIHGYSAIGMATELVEAYPDLRQKIDQVNASLIPG